ncbi:MAG: NAD(P)-dependent oxidoreductase [Betaproteobacteria bacterium]|nr:NAD(P)-dependent oxidoreductase [Betaproteobacteria bacterium]
MARLVQRLLLTGAAGNIGRDLRTRLAAHCQALRVSDAAHVGPARPGEECVTARLEDAQAMDQLLAGVDAVVHMGGVPEERSFDSILAANIVGLRNLYESARRHGVRRLVVASSLHVTGFYRQDEVVDAHMPARPDGYYAISKLYGENLGRYYFDRFGMETVSLRIGSYRVEPLTRRELSSWIPVVGHTIVYGVSANASSWWDNRSAQHLGYQPQDDASAYAARLNALEPTLDLNNPATVFQGGLFVRNEPQ